MRENLILGILFVGTFFVGRFSALTLPINDSKAVAELAANRDKAVMDCYRDSYDKAAEIRDLRKLLETSSSAEMAAIEEVHVDVDTGLEKLDDAKKTFAEYKKNATTRCAKQVRKALKEHYWDMINKKE